MKIWLGGTPGTDLAARETLTIPTADGNRPWELAVLWEPAGYHRPAWLAWPEAGVLWLGGGQEVYVLDLATAAVRHHQILANYFMRLALTPDRTRMLVIDGAAVAAYDAAQTAAKATFGKKLVIARVTAKIEGKETGVSGQQQVFCLTGTVDGAPFEFETATFFPSYVPMFGTVTVNGKDLELTQADAQSLVKLIKAADKPANQTGLSNLMYGLEFRASHEIGGLAQ